MRVSTIVLSGTAQRTSCLTDWFFTVVRRWDKSWYFPLSSIYREQLVAIAPLVKMKKNDSLRCSVVKVCASTMISRKLWNKIRSFLIIGRISYRLLFFRHNWMFSLIYYFQRVTSNAVCFHSLTYRSVLVGLCKKEGNMKRGRRIAAHIIATSTAHASLTTRTVAD